MLGIITQNKKDPIDFFITFCISMIIMSVMWLYPNYVYFRNRKYYFGIDDNIEYEEE